jgi:hypothetical protein
VLIVGGADNSGKTLSSTIVYQPSNGSFAAGPDMLVLRERHTATLLSNGMVLVYGGRSKSGNSYTPLATYQLCDATSCTQPATAPAGARHSHVAMPLDATGSKVLVAGGTDGTLYIATAWVYDVATNSWSNAAGSISPARRELTLSEVPFGGALAAGGRAGSTPLKASDLYNGAFATTLPVEMKVGRAGHTATTLKDSSGNITGVLVTGGLSGTTPVSVNSAEIYGLAPP